MTDHSGVLLARDDGVIEVLDAVPISADLQAQLDAICDLLGVPARTERKDSET